MNLPMRLAQSAVNAAWRLTHPGEKAISPTQTSIPGSGGWVSLIRESFAGAWQRNVEVRVDTVLTYSAVFRCISLISSDIAKMRIRLVELGADKIWREVTNTAHSPVLRRPNHYQNRIQFFTAWVESKLIHGNAYVLKQRDNRRVVTAMYVLNPDLVRVLVTADGGVYYELSTDQLSGIPETSVVVPSSEVIHDRWNTINHPLVGTSPIHACGLAAVQGLKIQDNSARFFANGSQPGGVLTAPGHINDDTARRLKEMWDQKYGAGGSDIGKVAVLGDGLKYEAMAITAADSQLLEQLKWTAETVASVFGVPAFKIGVGTPPTYNNIEALDAQYYSQCLQIHIESIELCLDEGLELDANRGTEFDLDGLLRMDTATKVKSVAEAIKAGFMAPNEGRSKFDMPPVAGGEMPYLQEQNWPLQLLADRELPARPPTAPADPEPAEDTEDDDGGDEARAYLAADFLRRAQPHYVPTRP